MKKDFNVSMSKTNPYNSIGSFLKSEFGCKIIKLSLDGGFTCPNRDGSLGTGGCIFCSEKGSGDFAGNGSFSIHDQLSSQVKLLETKWPTGKYIAYFQKFTNTYGDVAKMRGIFYEALSYPNVVGLAIATRPDCLNKEVLALLDELNQTTFLWLELGLQTIHEKTADLINRCYPLSTFDVAIDALSKLNIKTVVHLIIGLPGETCFDILDSARYISEMPIFGIKLQLLHVLKGTRLEALYFDDLNNFHKNEAVPAIYGLSFDDYISLVVDILEFMPENITIHRLTGDAPRQLLVAPLWSSNKLAILNGIQKEFKRRKSYQGIKSQAKHPYLFSSSLPSL